MLDSVYHMTLKLFHKCVFGVKMSSFCHIYETSLWASFHNGTKFCNSLAGYLFYLYH